MSVLSRSCAQVPGFLLYWLILLYIYVQNKVQTFNVNIHTVYKVLLKWKICIGYNNSKIPDTDVHYFLSAHRPGPLISNKHDLAYTIISDRSTCKHSAIKRCPDMQAQNYQGVLSLRFFFALLFLILRVDWIVVRQQANSKFVQPTKGWFWKSASFRIIQTETVHHFVAALFP